MSDGISDGAVLSLLGDTCKRFYRQLTGQQSNAHPGASGNGSGAGDLRPSSGMREFWKSIQSSEPLHILDLGSASQANITFITGMGHKLYTEDLLRTVQLAMPAGQSADAEFDGGRFFRENLKYAEGQFDGILCWDLFDFLADPMVKPLVDQLQGLLKPGGTVLSFFHTGQVGQEIPVFQYRIRSETTLQLIGQGNGKLHRQLNNRTIENLFRGFGSLKFYLTRDNLREVIVVR
jgi:hypothetical protein